MRFGLRPMIERSVRLAFGVDQYADAFEKLAILDRRSRLGPMFQHKISPELRDHPLLFIHVPKNGGTSVKRSLYATDPGHASVRFYDWLAPSLRAKATCFALLRNPVERFLSGFDFLLNGGGSEVSIQPAARRRLAGVRSVDQFLDRLEAIGQQWFGVDTFARPQWWYITDRQGQFAIDHLWIVGEHNREIGRLLESRCLPPLAHVNRTQRSKRQLSPTQLERLERIYAPDFALYAAVSAEPGIGGRSLGWIAVPQM